jgi:hypothetical protein
MKKWIMSVAVAALSITAMSFEFDFANEKSSSMQQCRSFGTPDERQAFLTGYHLACIFLGIPAVPYEEDVKQDCYPNGTCDAPVYWVCFAN